MKVVLLVPAEGGCGCYMKVHCYGHKLSKHRIFVDILVFGFGI